MKISETIEHITEHWKLKGFFDDDQSRQCAERTQDQHAIGW